MHMLTTCVSTMSCILMLSLLRKKMARSTTASAGQYVHTNTRTCHTLTHYACAFSGVKASHILDICTFAKCFTMCSSRHAHSTKARSQFTCAAHNSSWCDAMKCRNCYTPYVACSLIGTPSKHLWSNNIANSSNPLGSMVAWPFLMLASNKSVTARAGPILGHYLPVPHATCLIARHSGTTKKTLWGPPSIAKNVHRCSSPPPPRQGCALGCSTLVGQPLSLWATLEGEVGLRPVAGSPAWEGGGTASRYPGGCHPRGGGGEGGGNGTCLIPNRVTGQWETRVSPCQRSLLKMRFADGRASAHLRTRDHRLGGHMAPLRASRCSPGGMAVGEGHRLSGSGITGEGGGWGQGSHHAGGRCPGALANGKAIIRPVEGSPVTGRPLVATWT